MSAKKSPSPEQQRLVLSGGHVVIGEGVIHNGIVVIDDNIIEGVYLPPEYEAQPGDRVIDCAGAFVCPGFIDLHNQGGGGFTVMDGSTEHIRGMCRFHATHGTTGLLATPAIDLTRYRDLLPALAEHVGTDTGGAALLGIHAEGPFVNPLRIGCMPSNAVTPPDPAMADEIIELCGDSLAEVTIAPELPGAEEIMLRFARRNVVVSIGHTDADLMTILRAIDCGASHITHFFNAMRPFHHREPGPVGAGLFSSELTVEVIPDGHHVHPWNLGFVVQSKGVHRTCLVTDSMPPAGLGDGEHDALGNTVTVRDNRLTLADDDTVLAGSVLTMDRAVAGMITMVGMTISDAVTMAATTPAAVLGLDHKKGLIEPGYDADITVLDSTWRTVRTFVGGRIVFDAPHSGGV
jgi:N-acetylglucosamine-6-phosphate deacetylase